MRKILFLNILFLIFLFNNVAFCDGLIVYGNNFSFTVTEPINWIGDTSNALKFQANVIFYPKTPSEKPTIIRVRINSKVDENTNKDLAYDMEQYKKKYPKITFKDIEAIHQKYKVFPKLFYIQNNFYVYVTYINPGEGIDKLFSVSMNIQKREATESELNAYKKVIESLIFLTEAVKINK